MINFILGVSLAANLALLLFLIAACSLVIDYRKRLDEQENPYSELADLMHDSDWDRIHDINPPPRTGAEPPHTLVASAGKRSIDNIRR
jgi:hypothetical protein